MEKNLNVKEESNIDIRGTFISFIKPDEPELSQEEAIIKYKDYSKRRKHMFGNNSDSSSDEEDETHIDDDHMNRIKAQLLESLKRVDNLEKSIYGKKDLYYVEKKKVKGSYNGGQMSQSIARNESNNFDYEDEIDNSKEFDRD